MSTKQGSRAAKGLDGALFRVRRPRALARELTKLLARDYPLRWMSTGPQALYRPPYAFRRRAQRRAAKVRDQLVTEQTYANTKRRLGKKPTTRKVQILGLWNREENLTEVEWRKLLVEEGVDSQGESKSRTLERVAEEMRVSRSTLHRLLHGARRMRWQTAGALWSYFGSSGWPRLVKHLWPVEKNAEFLGHVLKARTRRAKE